MTFTEQHRLEVKVPFGRHRRQTPVRQKQEEEFQQ